MRSYLLLSLGVLVAACEFDGGADVPRQPPLMCDGAPDPLETGGVDTYDCTILAKAAAHQHPDAMLVKAQIAQESQFDIIARSQDSPCGIKAGWTDEESKSFGLTQVTPACGEATSARLPDGHPNLTRDMQSSLWANSVYNPEINIEEGVTTMSRMLRDLKAKYPGCTEAQYNLMSAGAFNSGPNSILGCGMYNDRAAMYVTAVLDKYGRFAQAASWPNPY